MTLSVFFILHSLWQQCCHFGLLLFVSMSKVSPITCSACSMFTQIDTPLSSEILPGSSHATSDGQCLCRGGWINWRGEAGEAAEMGVWHTAARPCELELVETFSPSSNSNTPALCALHVHLCLGCLTAGQWFWYEACRVGKAGQLYTSWSVHGIKCTFFPSQETVQIW